MSLRQESVNRELLERLERLGKSIAELEKIVAELNAQPKREILKVKKPNA
jgi:NAD(P)H-dependent FMN reductase